MRLSLLHTAASQVRLLSTIRNYMNFPPAFPFYRPRDRASRYWNLVAEKEAARVKSAPAVNQTEAPAHITRALARVSIVIVQEAWNWNVARSSLSRSLAHWQSYNYIITRCVYSSHDCSARARANLSSAATSSCNSWFITVPASIPLSLSLSLSPFFYPRACNFGRRGYPLRTVYGYTSV